MDEVNYWNLPPRARGLLTHEQVGAFADYELMRKGILVVAPPPVLPIATVDYRTTEYFAIKEEYSEPRIGFTSVDAAQAFIDLKPLSISGDWETDATLAKRTEFVIKSVRVMDESEHARVKVLLKKNREAKRANEKAAEEYAESVRKQDAALETMWDDWHEQAAKEQTAQEIIRLFGEYVTRCKGDAYIAMEFLLLVKPKDEIIDAYEWLGLPSPPFDRPRKAVAS